MHREPHGLERSEPKHHTTLLASYLPCMPWGCLADKGWSAPLRPVCCKHVQRQCAPSDIPRCRRLEAPVAPRHTPGLIYSSRCARGSPHLCAAFEQGMPQRSCALLGMPTPMRRRREPQGVRACPAQTHTLAWLKVTRPPQVHPHFAWSVDDSALPRCCTFTWPPMHRRWEPQGIKACPAQGGSTLLASRPSRSRASGVASEAASSAATLPPADTSSQARPSTCSAQTSLRYRPPAQRGAESEELLLFWFVACWWGGGEMVMRYFLLY